MTRSEVGGYNAYLQRLLDKAKSSPECEYWTTREDYCDLDPKFLQGHCVEEDVEFLSIEEWLKKVRKTDFIPPEDLIPDEKPLFGNDEIELNNILEY